MRIDSAHRALLAKVLFLLLQALLLCGHLLQGFEAGSHA